VVRLGLTKVSIQERPVDTLDVPSGSVVEMLFSAEKSEASLSDLRALKALIGQAEKRLALREAQALRAKNLRLNFD